MSIVIDGVDIDMLASLRNKLQKGAAKFISEGIAEVESMLEVMMQGTYIDFEVIDKAEQILRNVALVSAVSGVEYYLEYNEPYGGNDDVLSTKLEDWAYAYDLHPYSGELGELLRKLENMERESRLWNSSSVDC